MPRVVPRVPKAVIPGTIAVGQLAKLPPGKAWDGSPVVHNPDGTTSSVLTMSFAGPRGREILIPTVANGRIMGEAEARQRYHRTGQHFGIFKNPQQANRYAEWLHQREARRGK